jgi:ubiquinone biosynthesis protein UbiJ
MADPAADVASRAANRLLGDERWAREALGRHAGRTFSVNVGPLTTRFAIAADGSLSPAADPTALTDVEIVVPPWNVPLLLADPSRWQHLVAATGDAALASTLQDLAQTLPWFVERAFASALGPIAGQRLADAGRALLAFPGYASERFAESVGSYARDEAQVVASGAEGRAFGDEVATVAARVDALAERIDRIASAIAARGPRPVD